MLFLLTPANPLSTHPIYALSTLLPMLSLSTPANALSFPSPVPMFSLLILINALSTYHCQCLLSLSSCHDFLYTLTMPTLYSTLLMLFLLLTMPMLSTYPCQYSLNSPLLLLLIPTCLGSHTLLLPELFPPPLPMLSLLTPAYIPKPPPCLIFLSPTPAWVPSCTAANPWACPTQDDYEALNSRLSICK